MLAKTALLCSKQPSDLVGIEDWEIASAFNFECADILNQWEMDRETEKEKRQLELLTGQALSSAFGGGVPSEASGHKVDRW